MVCIFKTNETTVCLNQTNPNPKYSQQARAHEQPSRLKCVYTLEGPKNVDGGNTFKFQGIIEFPERFLIKGGKKEEKYLSNDYAAIFSSRCTVPWGCRANESHFLTRQHAALAAAVPDAHPWQPRHCSLWSSALRPAQP